jgi:fused signal recognition particle receptor
MQKLIKNLNFLWNKFRKNNEKFWAEIEEQFILNDISALTAEEIIRDVRNKSIGENINDAELLKNLLRNKIISILSENTNIMRSGDTPYIKESVKGRESASIWMIVGVNGVGKTSSIAKLARMFKSEGKKVLLTAADTFRAAAFEQIDHFAGLLDIPVVHHQRYSDPGAVVFDSIEKAAAGKFDIVLIDTAGRMHTAANLMEELKKIKRVIIKKTGSEPDEILMAVDSTTGQNSMSQTSAFHEALGLTGLILTKTDGTSRGGIVITIMNELGVPVKYITNGEKLENIEPFDPIIFTDRIIN